MKNSLWVFMGLAGLTWACSSPVAPVEKEKLLAAKNAGIKTVLVPKKNLADVEELSQEITKGLEILPVEHMEEVLKAAFVSEDQDKISGGE